MLCKKCGKDIQAKTELELGRLIAQGLCIRCKNKRIRNTNTNTLDLSYIKKKKIIFYLIVIVIVILFFMFYS